MPVVVADDEDDLIKKELFKKKHATSQSSEDEDEVESEEDNEIEGDYAKDGENVEQAAPTLLKPVFLSKSDREVLHVTDEKRKLDLDEAEERAFQEKQREERKQYTK